LLGAAVLVGLLTAMGYMLCVVPGVILSLMWAVTTPAIVVESVGAWEGMRRSRHLAADNLGKVFVVVLIVSVLVFLVSAPFVFSGAIVQAILTQFKQPLLGVALSQVISLPGQLVGAPISAAAVVLLYYDLRIRKEAFDLEMLAESMAGAPGADR
jgi:hypothetical protein